MGMLLRILIFAFVGYFVARTLRRLLLNPPAGGTHSKTDRNSQDNPYEILGVRRDADLDEIKNAYRERLKEYHPDKVSHLGEDLQNVAREKTQKITWAFETLSKK